MNSAKKVVLGISGGVDSSVAAYLLKREGYDVTGVFMNNWHETEDDACTAHADYIDAKSVCLKLDIPFYSVDFAQEYQEKVFSYFLSEYSRGRTPNPDILCNSEIKFDCFLKYAREVFGAEYIATGHYVRNLCENDRTLLLKGSDPEKDQSYFLCALKAEQIKDAVFPIGGMQKREVREIAVNLGLRTAQKKDSTGICFIGERNFRNFLSTYLPAKPGDILDKDSGKKIGTHNGLMYYTIAQRRGLGIGNMGGGERWFVCDKDMQENILYVCEGAENPHLFKKGFTSYNTSFVEELDKCLDITKAKATADGCEFDCRVKYRYRQQDRPAHIKLYKTDNGARAMQCIFEEKQSGLAPGQSGALYVGDVCLGSGVIDSVEPE